MALVIKEVNEDMIGNKGRFSGLLTRFSTHLHPVVGRGSGLDDVIFINMEVAVSIEDEAAIVDRLAACLASEAVLETMEFSIMVRGDDD